MKRPEDYTEEERGIMAVCEACYLAIAQEEFLRHESGDSPLTELQMIIIYQRYQDMIVLKYPSERWNEIADMFDALFADVVEGHKEDSLIYA